jgi:hypothetical protein
MTLKIKRRLMSLRSYSKTRCGLLRVNAHTTIAPDPWPTSPHISALFFFDSTSFTMHTLIINARLFKSVNFKPRGMH